MSHSEVHHPHTPSSGDAGEAVSTSQRRVMSAADIALVATFAALTAVCAILPAITIGGLVPITLQTFAVLLTGAVLGARRGFFAILLYIGIGIIGLPVFASGAAGLAPFAGPSVGYLVAMPFAASLTGFMVQRLNRRSAVWTTVGTTLAAIIAGIVVMYPLGIAGLMWRAGMSFGEAFVANLAFVPGDLIKAILAGLIASAVHRAFPDLLPRNRHRDHR